MTTENTATSFFDTCAGGATGYLHRCQEQLRLKGANTSNEDEMIEALGYEVYSNMLEAAKILREKKDKSQTE